MCTFTTPYDAVPRNPDARGTTRPRDDERDAEEPALKRAHVNTAAAEDTPDGTPDGTVGIFVNGLERRVNPYTTAVRDVCISNGDVLAFGDRLLEPRDVPLAAFGVEEGAMLDVVSRREMFERFCQQCCVAPDHPLVHNADAPACTFNYGGVPCSVCACAAHRAAHVHALVRVVSDSSEEGERTRCRSDVYLDATTPVRTVPERMNLIEAWRKDAVYVVCRGVRADHGAPFSMYSMASRENTAVRIEAGKPDLDSMLLCHMPYDDEKQAYTFGVYTPKALARGYCIECLTQDNQVCHMEHRTAAMRCDAPDCAECTMRAALAPAGQQVPWCVMHFDAMRTHTAPAAAPQWDAAARVFGTRAVPDTLDALGDVSPGAVFPERVVGVAHRKRVFAAVRAALQQYLQHRAHTLRLPDNLGVAWPFANVDAAVKHTFHVRYKVALDKWLTLDTLRETVPAPGAAATPCDWARLFANTLRWRLASLVREMLISRNNARIHKDTPENHFVQVFAHEMQQCVCDAAMSALLAGSGVFCA